MQACFSTPSLFPFVLSRTSHRFTLLCIFFFILLMTTMAMMKVLFTFFYYYFLRPLFLFSCFFYVTLFYCFHHSMRTPDLFFILGTSGAAFSFLFGVWHVR